MAKLHELLIDRMTFFAKRIEYFAKKMGLTNDEAINKLNQISVKQPGEITGIIDELVPPELHSSMMPPILKEHYGN